MVADAQGLTTIKDRLPPAKDATMPMNLLQQLRAVQVMELIGTPDARDVLTSWSRGAKDAPLTKAAVAAIERK